MRNNSGIDNGADVPAATLTELYEDVKAAPLRLKGSRKLVIVQLVQALASNTLPDTIFSLHDDAVAALANQAVPGLEKEKRA